METLLTGIAQYQVHTALLDITGVKIIDAQIATVGAPAGDGCHPH
jgi:hypothetical protein